MVTTQISFFEYFSQLLNKVENIERNIEQFLLNQNNQTQPEADELLTIQQAAELLCLSVKTIYGLTHRCEIPYSKLSKRLYFSKKELLEWVKEGRKKTFTEIANEADTYILNSKGKGVKHG